MAITTNEKGGYKQQQQQQQQAAAAPTFFHSSRRQAAKQRSCPPQPSPCIFSLQNFGSTLKPALALAAGFDEASGWGVKSTHSPRPCLVWTSMRLSDFARRLHPVLCRRALSSSHTSPSPPPNPRTSHHAHSSERRHRRRPAAHTVHVAAAALCRPRRLQHQQRRQFLLAAPEIRCPRAPRSGRRAAEQLDAGHRLLQRR